jgi:plastocyanin
MVKQRPFSGVVRLVACLAVVGLVGAAGVLGAEAATPAKPKAAVSLGDNFFKPTKLTVAQGTTVKFTWTGTNTHNVTVVSGPQKFHSSDQASGSYSHTMTKVGTYKIVCTFHPGMVMTLKVKKAAPSASTTTASS